jgi:hypothetical protein
MVAGFLATILASSFGFTQAVTIERTANDFRIIGWSAGEEPPQGWQALFELYAGEGDVPPMLGTYTVEQGTLVFRPRYPLTSDVQIRAIFRPPQGEIVETVFRDERPDREPSTFVSAVYPSTDAVPDNLLKIYVEFSAPMSRGEAWQHIRLLDEAGSPGDAPFLEIDQELWDPTNTRLTLLFDPGRIKQGVLPREQLGPALLENREYTLVIDAAWRDAAGAPLTEEFRKELRVGPSDRTPPDPETWRISIPWSRTKDALVIAFPETMDWALLRRLITVSGPSGPVSGSASVEEQETRWRFVPEKPWQGGDYQIIVSTTLEDLAGNKIGRLFDVDLDRFESVTQRVAQPTISLPFRIAGE